MENTDANTINVADALSNNYTLVFMPIILTLLENYQTVRASWTDVTVIGEGAAFPLKSIMDSITDKLDALGISWNSSYIDDENMSYRHGLIKCKNIGLVYTRQLVMKKTLQSTRQRSPFTTSHLEIDCTNSTLISQ